MAIRVRLTSSQAQNIIWAISSEIKKLQNEKIHYRGDPKYTVILTEAIKGLEEVKKILLTAKPK